MCPQLSTGHTTAQKHFSLKSELTFCFFQNLKSERMVYVNTHTHCYKYFLCFSPSQNSVRS